MAKAEGAGMVIGVREAAEYLGVSMDTVYRYVNEAAIPGFKLCGRWRFHRDLLDKFMRDQSKRGVRRG
jgi:excisionase family DNA binding protein